MKLLGLLLLLLPAFASANDGAKNTSQVGQCVPADHMSEIARDFSQFSKYAGKEFCFDGSLESNLLTGIYFMRSTSFENVMDKSQDDLFSGRFASDWYNYFVQRIRKITIDHNCPKRVGAYVYGWGSTMYVCTFLLSDIFTGLDRASVFMHEARHIDGYPHTTCNSGPRAGLRGACDTRISDGGSYAVTVETYAQLARYAQNLHPAMKAYSRASSVIYADETFQYPTTVDRKNHFLLLTQDKRFHALDVANNNGLQQLGESEHLGHIVMRAQMMVMIPDDKTQNAQFVFANDEGAITQQPGTSTEEYNKSTPAQRAELIDLHIASQWDARLYKDRVELKCDPRSDRVSTVSTNGEIPASILYFDGYSRAASSVKVLMESGKIYELGCRPSAHLTRTPMTIDRMFKRVHRSGAHAVGLGYDGMIYEIVGDTSTHIPTSLDGTIHELVPAQSYMFFDK